MRIYKFLILSLGVVFLLSNCQSDPKASWRVHGLPLDSALNKLAGIWYSEDTSTYTSRNRILLIERGDTIRIPSYSIPGDPPYLYADCEIIYAEKDFIRIKRYGDTFELNISKNWDSLRLIPNPGTLAILPKVTYTKPVLPDYGYNVSKKELAYSVWYHLDTLNRIEYQMLLYFPFIYFVQIDHENHQFVKFRKRLGDGFTYQGNVLFEPESIILADDYAGFLDHIADTAWQGEFDYIDLLNSKDFQAFTFPLYKADPSILFSFPDSNKLEIRVQGDERVLYMEKDSAQTRINNMVVDSNGTAKNSMFTKYMRVPKLYTDSSTLYFSPFSFDFQSNYSPCAECIQVKKLIYDHGAPSNCEYDGDYYVTPRRNWLIAKMYRGSRFSSKYAPSLRVLPLIPKGPDEFKKDSINFSFQ